MIKINVLKRFKGRINKKTKDNLLFLKDYLLFLEQFHLLMPSNYLYLEYGVQRFLSFKLSKAFYSIGVDIATKYSSLKKGPNFVSNLKSFTMINDDTRSFVDNDDYIPIRNIFKLDKPHLTFIDASHEAIDVLYDIYGVAKLLKQNKNKKFILLHDVLPKNTDEFSRDNLRYVGDAIRVLCLLSQHDINFKILNIEPSGLALFDKSSLNKLYKLNINTLEKKLLSVSFDLTELKGILKNKILNINDDDYVDFITKIIKDG